MEFTDPQRELIELPGSVFVEACPGAGKTQCIVERFFQRPGNDGRRGVALLSFTNAAINEAKRRSVGQPGLLEPPNFVGTIDSFINRYIVTPVYTTSRGRAPTFKDSWESVQGTSFNVPVVPGVDFQLAWFSFDSAGFASLEPKRAPFEQRQRLKNLNSTQRRSATARAAQVWQIFENNGVMDSAGARTMMLRYLADPGLESTLGRLLSSRFSEVIVDEVQDCADSDVRLINFLLDHNVNVIMVGDMDQAIYGFRGSSIEEIRALTRRVRPGTRLNGNFRSSQKICSLNDSLRHGSSTDVALGAYATEPHAVRLLRVDDLSAAAPKITSIAAEIGAGKTDIIVLAHSEKDARTCAGASDPPGRSTSRLFRLAAASATLQDSRANARARALAIQTIEGVIRELSADELHHLADHDFFAQVGMVSRVFRDGCLRLAHRIKPFEVLPSVFRQELVTGLSGLGWTWARASGLRTPSGDKWPAVSEASPDALPFSTVHSFKGMQAPVVAVAIPGQRPGWVDNDSGVALWLNGEPGEARRVLYVGASRAQRLVILAVHATQYPRVKRCLERDNVKYLEELSF